MTTEEIHDAFSEQIMRVHIDAVKAGVNRPELRSVMTDEARKRLFQHEIFNHMTEFGLRRALSCDFEFRGSKVTIVPGDDIHFNTRCTNLPQP